MKAIIVIALLFCAHSICEAQKIYSNKAFGFSMEVPERWFSIDSATVVQNQENYAFTDEQAQEMLKLRKGIISFVSLMKYDPKEFQGIIPTIKINARTTATTDPVVFKNNIKKSLEQSMATFSGFAYQSPFAVTTINNAQVITATIVYTLPQDEELLPARTFLYYFLRKGYFISVSFSDVEGKADEKELFTRLIRTVYFKQ